MNKPALRAMRKQGQSGFTLIELIVVIVILGILAATALPKFSSLSGDARLASLNAAKGALATTSAMVHGQYLINPSPTLSLNYEGTTVTASKGYAKADANTATAAGLNASDYTITVGPGTASANKPAIATGAILIQPASIANTPTGLTCYLTYTEAVDTNTPPVLNMVGSANGCN
ncbi:MAG TPA: type II secretion system protein [Duganella sp.]|jgi:MSHA pilin protein MshA